MYTRYTCIYTIYTPLYAPLNTLYTPLYTPYIHPIYALIHRLLDAIEAERLRLQLEAEAGIRQKLLNWGMGLLGEDPHSHVKEGNGFQFMDGERGGPSSSKLQPLSLKRPSSPMGYGERARFMEGDGLDNGDEAWFEAERQRRVAAEEAAREREREEGELVRMRLEEREQREVRRRIMC